MVKKSSDKRKRMKNNYSKRIKRATAKYSAGSDNQFNHPVNKNTSKQRRQCQCTPQCKNIPSKNDYFCHIHKNCTRRSPLSGYEPDYNPSEYNHKKTRKLHNCFAYAFDHIEIPKKNTSHEFHQPGRKSGFPKWDDVDGKRCPDLLSRIRADVPDTKLSSFTEKCPPNYSKIALVVDPDSDYHFYRQDSNELWSHKPGSTMVTNTDSNNIRIYDPSLAGRDYSTGGSPNYNQFCGFMCIPRNKKHTFKRGGKHRNKTKKHKS